MKIFPTKETSRLSETRSTGETGSVKKGHKGKKRGSVAEKQKMSEREIREKLAAHVETSNTAKSASIKKNSQKLGDGFMNSEIKPQPIAVAEPVVQQSTATATEKPAVEEMEKPEKHLLKTDINLNDPKDPGTQEKLKTVLSSGAFSFNARERETLDKILNGN